MSEEGGVILKGEDGTAYFIRDDVLEACKLEGEYLENVRPFIEGGEAEVEGFALQARAQSFTSVGNFSAKINAPALQTDLASKIGNRSYDTVMCPW